MQKLPVSRRRGDGGGTGKDLKAQRDGCSGIDASWHSSCVTRTGTNNEEESTVAIGSGGISSNESGGV